MTQTRRTHHHHAPFGTDPLDLAQASQGAALLGGGTLGWPQGGTFLGSLALPGLGPTLDPTLGPTLGFRAAPLGAATSASASLGSALPGTTMGNGGAPAPLATARGAGLTIKITYDQSPLSLPSGFTTAVDTAVQFFESQFSNPMTINIAVGWGNLPNLDGTVGSSLGSALGQSSSTGVLVDYATLLQALYTAASSPTASADQRAAYNSLVNNPPALQGGASGNPAQIYISQAEANALGLGTLAQPFDGTIGLSSSATFTYDPNNRAVSGKYDAIGVIEHEISEVMGRTAMLGTLGTAGEYTPLDLFRYSSPGTRNLTAGAGSAFFSPDGTTMLTQFNNPATAGGGDAGDWAVPATSGDAFVTSASSGVANVVTSSDVRLLNVLGYTLAAACYAAGTRIRTPRGEVPIEALRVGETVLTRFAGAARIRWIGTRRIDCHRHPDPAEVRPVRVAAGAFGPGLPARDLRLSPDHAVALDGALVPIRLLANGGSIAQDAACAEVRYLHLELDRHDLIFAEGLAAETYLDTGNRAMFENAPGAVLLHPRPCDHADDPAAQARREAGSCLPFRAEPAWVAPRWRALAARSETLGFALPAMETTEDPGLCLEHAGRRIVPVLAAAGRSVFVVPGGPGAVRLASRHVVPSVVRPWIADRRRLGVRIDRLILRHGTEEADIALDDPCLASGWWAPERDGAALWRWTDGAAALPSLRAGAVLELRIGETLAYPLAAAPARRAA